MALLVIDDNKTLLLKVVKSLLRANHQVKGADSLAEARRLLQQERPDAICLDLQLTDGHGLDFLAELRQQHPRLPVIIISANCTPENRQQAEALGVHHFLAKPFSLSRLNQLLCQVLAAAADQPPPDPSSRCDNNRRDNKRNDALQPIEPNRLGRAKRAYSTRRVSISGIRHLLTGSYRPVAGDLVLARIDKLNQHKRLELPSGRRATLHDGDEVIVCYGNRYAPDQFEAELPPDLAPCHLVAAGGVAAQVKSRHGKIRAATRITPIGVLAHADGSALNLRQWGLTPPPPPSRTPPVIAVLGTSMNAGKTTTVAGIGHGLVRQGLRVGAAKVTGTGAGCDVWAMLDAGCQPVLDFTDCGHPATYRLSLAQCIEILDTQIDTLTAAGAEVILLEVADGILQQETASLIACERFRQRVDHLLFAAGDALGAIGGAQWLLQRGYPLVGVSGAVTASPLATAEAEAGLLQVPIVDLATLEAGGWMRSILEAHCQLPFAQGDSEWVA